MLETIAFICTIIGLILLAIYVTLKDIERTEIFYEKAKSLESSIKQGESVELVAKELWSLKKFALGESTLNHWITLAKMFEVKYNESILKYK